MPPARARARAALQSERRRFDFAPERHQRLLEAFFAAIDQGDAEALNAILAEDVAVYSDSGGLAPAARKVLRTREIAARFFLGLARKRRKAEREQRVRFARVNGLPGALIYSDTGRVETALGIAVSNGRIQAIYQQRNPQKLRGLDAAEPTAAVPL